MRGDLLMDVDEDFEMEIDDDIVFMEVDDEGDADVLELSVIFGVKLCVFDGTI
jgi:hypothetical protein